MMCRRRRYVDILGEIRQIGQTGRPSSGNFRVFMSISILSRDLFGFRLRESEQISQFGHYEVRHDPRGRPTLPLPLSPFLATIYKEYDILSLIPVELLITSFTTFIATPLLPHQAHPTYATTWGRGRSTLELWG